MASVSRIVHYGQSSLRETLHGVNMAPKLLPADMQEKPRVNGSASRRVKKFQSLSPIDSFLDSSDVRRGKEP